MHIGLAGTTTVPDLRRWCVLLVCALPAQGQGQSTPLAPVNVTASPLAPDALESAVPTSVLTRPELERRRSTTLGSTLTNLPGVQDSGFGTAAGRPVIRGLDGPRVRIAENGLQTQDAATLSPDHAVGIDPLGTRRIEVLRGPATLLYGGGAIGGLVNVVSDLIPTTRLTGVGGDASLASDSASGGHAAGASLRGGASGWNWTAGAFDRAGGDYRIPGPAVRDDPDSARGRQPNSFTRADGFSGGVSYVGQRGAIGIGHGELSNRYGIPSEDGVFIDLRQRRTEGLAELDEPIPGFTRARIKWLESRYRHDEIEGTSGEIGTAIRSRGRDARIELLHEPIASIRGAFGVQLGSRTLDALGDEAYVPNSKETKTALFYVGETDLGGARLEFGARSERARLTADDPASPSRRYTLNSASVGATVPITDPWAVSANLSLAERAPAIEELYANGPHAATATFEIGNADLARERSVNLDLSLRRTRGDWQGRIGVYANRFRNYIAGLPSDDNGDGIADRVDGDNTITNSAVDPAAGEFTRLTYGQARARFHGIEGELVWKTAASPWSARVFGDLARGTLDASGNLPRMSPARFGASIDYGRGSWSGFVSLLSVLRQDRVARLETTTGGYQRLDAEIAYTVGGGGRDTGVTVFLQGRNLLDEQVRVHTSYIKDLTLQPGRSFSVGVRARF